HGLRWFLLFVPGQSLDLNWLVGFLGVELLLQHHFLVKLAHHDGFFMRSLRSLHLRLVRPRQINFIQNQTVARLSELDILATGKNLVSAMLLIPLRDSRVLVHVFNNVPPANTRVVSAEGNLTFLSSVRNDAHLGAPEVVVEKILEPHSCDEQEVPAIRPARCDVLRGAIAGDLTVVFSGQAKRLVKLLKELVKRKLRRRLVRVVVLQKRQTHHDVRNPLAARCVGDLLHVSDETRNMQKLRHRTHLFVFLVDHHRRADATVRVASAGDLSPFGVWTMYKIRKVSKRSHQRQREPIARRFSDTNLVLHIVREVRQRVALLQTTLRSDLFVATGERNRLERQKRDLLRIVECEANDRTDLIVVDTVDQRRNENDLNACFVQVVDGAHLHVEQVADLTMAVGVVADAVKLKVNVTKTGCGCFAAELFALGKLDSVRRRLHAVVTNFA